MAAIALLVEWIVGEVSVMVSLETPRTVANLEAEMTRAGRVAEEGALREVLQALGRPEFGLLPEEQAGALLGISPEKVRHWPARGAVAGVELGGRWLVACESAERTRRLRDALTAIEEEGNPTGEESEELDRPHSKPPGARGS